DIFFNNGQLNWDAISTITNIILVAALIFITWLYARQVRKQTILMEKDRMKNKILEEIQDVLTPTIYSLEKEIEAIEKSKIFWYKSGEEGIFEGLFKIYGNSGAFKDVFEKFSDLEEMFLSHDNLYGKLNGLYTETEREIRTPELKERLENLLNTFYQSKREEAYERKLTENAYKLRDNEREGIFWWIINDWTPKRAIHTLEPRIDFWEEYRDKLLEFRNTSRVKELGKEIENRLTQLKELDGDLLDKIKEKREEYREEYQFTKYEIDPKLKELEEWLGMRT
ncbi:MAG: hypothetical protein KAV25_05175, partial [Methanophagales archaeon]|nr:hypothetical protein [Methanophagales archaeon]